MRTPMLVRSTALLAVAGLGLAGCSGGEAEKVASEVTSTASAEPTTQPTDDASEDATDEPSAEPSPDPSDDAPSTDDADDAGTSPGSTAVDGTQVVDLTGTGKTLTLEVPQGWQPSDAAGDEPSIVLVAVDPEPYENFSANVVVTVEPVSVWTTTTELFANHDAAAMGYDSQVPEGTVGTVSGYPSHVVSGLRAGPAGGQLAQSSTVVVVEGDDGTAVAVAIALTTHPDDAEGRSTLSALLDGATIG